jgi:aspartate/methionine/tyrosine aminotransferase
VVASDECYLALGWEAQPVSALHTQVCGGDHTGVLAVHSLSKSSNLAGYRAGFVAGDPGLVASLLAVRKHAGMIVPRPVQQAMVAALSDDTHVAQQRDRYARRRELDTVARLAEVGVLVAPGDFYGPSGSRHIRVGLTATDERVSVAVQRLAELP